MKMDFGVACVIAAVSGLALAQPVEPVLFEVEHPETFDPAKAGWKCVFEDEFEGTEFDTNKWYRPHFARKGRQKVKPDGNGHLVFHVKKNEKGVIPSTYLYSVPEYKYGYFEARVKFTNKAGWWAASWIHGGSKQNPFLDGFEIDTFEDFFTRLPEDHPLHNRMAHSLHSKIGDYGASYQLHSTPPDLNVFHTIACKWDPLGMTFYLDGSRVGGYSAFNNATCIRPLHAILSTEYRAKQWLNGRAEPEEGTFEIDWVRIWQDPAATFDVPTVTLKAETEQVFVGRGTNVKFKAVAVAAREDDPVYAIYLFDNGFLIDRRVERPYTFTVPMTDEYYAFSHYGRFTGHSGLKKGTKHPEFDSYPHVFVAFAKTRSGKVAHSEPIIRIPAPVPVPAPYEENPQIIPGTVEPWRFDVGGQGRAYHKVLGKLGKKRHQRSKKPRPEEKLDCSKKWMGITYAGEWVNYTVDVAKAGRYAATASFGSPLMSVNDLALLLDGCPVGAFPLAAEPYFTFSPSRKSTIEVDLPAGRHVLTVFFKSQIGFGGISFEPIEGK